MIYGAGLIEKNRLRKEKKKDENVYLARMGDNEGTYRLFVSAVSDVEAKKQLEEYCKNKTDGSCIVSIDLYDIERCEYKLAKDI